MNRHALITEFLTYLRYERHFSPHTTTAYRADMDEFCHFLNEHTTAGAIRQTLTSENADHIRAFIVSVKKRKCSLTTVARKLATLRSFYKFCMRRGYVLENPAATIKTPRIKRPTPKVLDLKQVKKLFSMPDETTLLGMRDRAIFETLYSAGIRSSELVALNIDDLDGRQIRIRRRKTFLRIGPTAAAAIRQYLKMRKSDRRNRTSDRTAMFVNKHGQRLGSRGVRRKFDKYLAAAGLDLSISPHTLRNTFAKHMLNSGASLQSVQELLGHRSLETTRIYERETA